MCVCVVCIRLFLSVVICLHINSIDGFKLYGTVVLVFALSGKDMASRRFVIGLFCFVFVFDLLLLLLQR